jgi:hypothetical protein
MVGPRGIEPRTRGLKDPGFAGDAAVMPGQRDTVRRCER